MKSTGDVHSVSESARMNIEYPRQNSTIEHSIVGKCHTISPVKRIKVISDLLLCPTGPLRLSVVYFHCDANDFETWVTYVCFCCHLRQ